MKIAILGAGAYGTALGGVLKESGYDIAYYDPKIEGADLGATINEAKYVILCVPSNIAPDLLTLIPKNMPLIIATKGFLSEEPFSEFGDYMVLSGPGFADELKTKKRTKLTITDARISELFDVDYITFDYTKDKLGVLMCGALKNVYAIMAGLLDLKPGTEEHEVFLTEVAEEMRALLLANGAETNTVNLACGKDDLRLTCAYPSRNYEFGQIVRDNLNYKPKNTVEGLTVLKSIKNHEIIIPDNAKKIKDLIVRSESWG